MRFLVDANVLSEGARAKPDRSVIAWLGANEASVAVDPIVLGELKSGILMLPAGKRRDRLTAWFDEGVNLLNCVPWDRAVGLRWAQLLADLRAQGRAIPVKDSMIAATALVYQLTVVTRNVRDFEAAEVPVLNPFST